MNHPDILRFRCCECGMEMEAPRALEGIEGPCVRCGVAVVAKDWLGDELVAGGGDGSIAGPVRGGGSDCGIGASRPHEHGGVDWSKNGELVELELLKGESATGVAAGLVPARRIEMVEQAREWVANVGAGRDEFLSLEEVGEKRRAGQELVSDLRGRALRCAVVILLVSAGIFFLYHHQGRLRVWLGRIGDPEHIDFKMTKDVSLEIMRLVEFQGAHVSGDVLGLPRIGLASHLPDEGWRESSQVQPNETVAISIDGE